MMKRIVIAAILAAALALPALANATAPGGMVRSASFFEYDISQPLSPKVEQLEKNARYTKYHVWYVGTNEQRVSAYLFTPSKGKEPFPCIIVMHGSGGSKDDFGVLYDYLALRGYAILAVDAAFHGERKMNTEIRAEKADWYQTRDMIIQTVVDLRRGIDFLEMRPEIDPNRVGFLGASQGTFIGTVFAGVETRIKAAALLVGGADFRTFFKNSQIPGIVMMRNYFSPEKLEAIADDLAVIDPQYYIGAISPRAVLLINGKKDYIISEAAGKRLHELAKEPKEMFWYDGGHLPAFDLILGVTPKFFGKYLKNIKTPPPTAPAPDVKPEIKSEIKREVSDPAHRFFTVIATTEQPLPKGVSLALCMPEVGPVNFPLFDDGSHGDAIAGDNVWTMRVEFGPVVPDIAFIGGDKIYKTEVRAVAENGAILSSVEAGILQ